MLEEVESKYVLNVTPYLGAQEKQSRNGLLLEESVVLKFIEPLKKKNYNVTTDNFFTSLQVAKKLQTQGTSMVGTV